MSLSHVWRVFGFLRGESMGKSGVPTTSEELETLMGQDDDIIRRTVPLSNQDYALIGQFVQAYCWADLNARRVINLLRVINRHDEEEFATRLNEKATIEHLKSEVDAMTVLPEVKSGLTKVAEILEMHHDVRHVLAHWSVRRARDTDGYIALTKFGREALRRGVSLDGSGDVIAYGFLPIDAIRGECQKLYGHGEYMANVVAFLAEHVERSKA